MKYRIKAIHSAKPRATIKKLKAKRRRRADICILPPALSSAKTVRIDLAALFSVNALPCANIKKVRAARRIYTTVKRSFAAAISKIRIIRLSRVKKRETRLAFFSGVLTASSVVSFVCAIAVLGKLFFPYLKSYTSVIVPSLIGERLDDAALEGGNSFELLVSYENNPYVSAGVIISQRPSSGVIRKIYDKNEPCIISVTVSIGKSFNVIDDLSGLDGRLALLSLYNMGISAIPDYVYSDTVEAGRVIESIPPKGAFLYEDEQLVLKISKGKKTVSVSVPDLYGLGEAQAISILNSKGLILGEVTYSASSLPSGKIISQQYSPFSTVSKGSTVDITVSIGQLHQQKSVPDLYGLTAEEATDRLSQVGLIIGSVTPVAGGAPSGTIISQSIAAGTPITSAITSVDVWISQ